MRHNKAIIQLLTTAMLAGATALAQQVPPATPPTSPATPQTQTTAPTPPTTSTEDADRARERAERDKERAQERAERDKERAVERTRSAQERAKAIQERARRTTVTYFGQGAYLGVDLQDINSDRAKALNLKEEHGAEVNFVDQDGPAGKAGVKSHDVILSFNGQRVEGVEELKRMIHETPPGRKVTLAISRDGKPLTVTAELADRRQLESSMFIAPRVVIPPIPPVHVEIPPMNINPQVHVFSMSSSNTGMSVEPLTPQLGDYFGAPSGQGLLVRSVEKGSPADQAGLKAGDVIIKLGGERVTDSGDWRMAIREHTGSVPVVIVRDKREQTLTLKVPERRSAYQSFNFDGDTYALDMRGLDDSMKAWQESMKQWQKEFGSQMKDWGKSLDEQMKKWCDDSGCDDDAPPPALKKHPAPLNNKKTAPKAKNESAA